MMRSLSEDSKDHDRERKESKGVSSSRHFGRPSNNKIYKYIP